MVHIKAKLRHSDGPKQAHKILKVVRDIRELLEIPADQMRMRFRHEEGVLLIGVGERVGGQGLVKGEAGVEELIEHFSGREGKRACA